MSIDAETGEQRERVNVDFPESGETQADDALSAPEAQVDVVSDATPHMASIETLWSRPVRWLVVVFLVGAAVAYCVFGTLLARNVTFNQSQGIDPGASNGIRRFYRETILGVWRTMWDKAPDFGTIDLTRGILLVSTMAFFAAFALVISLIFVPSRQEWTASLGDGQESDTIAGD